MSFYFFFFNDTATTEIYTLSLHDALPICVFLPRAFDQEDRRFVVRPNKILQSGQRHEQPRAFSMFDNGDDVPVVDRKSTRLNSSHLVISYAVFCLKKKKHTA